MPSLLTTLRVARSEVDARAYRYSAISCRRRDAAESVRVDVRIRVAPHRMVQEIHGVGTDREALALVDSEFLGEGRIDSEVCRTFEPALAGVSGESGIRILKDDISGAIHNYLVCETTSDRRVSAKIWNRRHLRLQ